MSAFDPKRTFGLFAVPGHTRAGHSSISTTLDIYSHAADALQQDATERLDNAFREIQDHSGGNRVAKALPSPDDDMVTI